MGLDGPVIEDMIAIVVRQQGNENIREGGREIETAKGRKERGRRG